jgi:hypothetical protein
LLNSNALLNQFPEFSWDKCSGPGNTDRRP